MSKINEVLFRLKFYFQNFNDVMSLAVAGIYIYPRQDGSFIIDTRYLSKEDAMVVYESLS